MKQTFIQLVSFFILLSNLAWGNPFFSLMDLHLMNRTKNPLCEMALIAQKDGTLLVASKGWPVSQYKKEEIKAIVDAFESLKEKQVILQNGIVLNGIKHMHCGWRKIDDGIVMQAMSPVINGKHNHVSITTSGKTVLIVIGKPGVRTDEKYLIGIRERLIKANL